MKPDFHSFRHEAMNTWLELSVTNGEAEYVRQAATEAFLEIDRLENILSRFREGSDIDVLNKLASREPVRVTEESWQCLLLALDLELLTEGTFSIAFESLMDAKVEPAGWLEMDEASRTVRFSIADVTVDLGGIGKGYVLDLVDELLVKDWDLDAFMIHSGTSTVLARGDLPPHVGWPASLGADQIPQKLSLKNESLSGSSLAVQDSHILDLKSQSSLETERRTWALASNAAISDALSTTFMLQKAEEIENLCGKRSDLGAFVIDPTWDNPVVAFGSAENRVNTH
ncbi:MAG: hypothetical protein CMI18_10805 [Opitutaceae bacterium]|nr:hypothetical protein [Opitutaceae bacterium]|tara:strand:+ start:920 stop:1774 length:855 start_codon:yes stop_codon:yes gene_type:complete